MWAQAAGRSVAVLVGMILFRSLALGLLGACFFLLATRPVTIVVRQPEIPNLSGIRGVPTAGPTVIDVARDAGPSIVPSLIRLAEGEHVVTIDDVAVANDLDAGRMLGERWLVTEGPPIAQHRYIDLEVQGPRGERRVLVLLH